MWEVDVGSSPSNASLEQKYETPFEKQTKAKRAWCYAVQGPEFKPSTTKINKAFFS
jgi:hypothetical protein